MNFDNNYESTISGGSWSSIVHEHDEVSFTYFTWTITCTIDDW